MEKSNKFGAKLKALRLERELSQEELAFQCNMQASHIGQLERGQKNPTLDTMAKIARGLDMSLPELLTFDSEKNGREYNKVVGKINAYLAVLNPKQQEQVLAIIKTFIDYR